MRSASLRRASRTSGLLFPLAISRLIVSSCSNHLLAQCWGLAIPRATASCYSKQLGPFLDMHAFPARSCRPVPNHYKVSAGVLFLPWATPASSCPPEQRATTRSTLDFIRVSSWIPDHQSNARTRISRLMVSSCSKPLGQCLLSSTLLPLHRVLLDPTPPSLPLFILSRSLSHLLLPSLLLLRLLLC